MAKKYNGTINFASALRPTGAQPLDDRMVVQSLTDLMSVATFEANGASAAYNGMMVAVLEEQKVFMLINAANLTEEKSWVPVGSGNGSLSVDTLDEAKALATVDNRGQIIFVVEENATYVVTGAATVMKLAASTADSIDEIVAALQSDINTLKGIVGAPASGETEATGLVKEVADLKASVEAIEIPEVPVQDVTVNGASVLNKETGVVEITMPDVTVYETIENVNKVREDVSANTEAIETLAGVVGKAAEGETEATGLVKAVADNAAAIETKVSKENGKRLMTDAEGTKLEGIEEGAQVNIIETIKVNGNALEVTEKGVNIEIESIKVKGVDGADKMLTLTEAGEIKSELSVVYLKSEDSEDGKPHIALFGKGGTTLISSIDATDFVKDGMISEVKLVDTAEGNKSLQIVWNTEAGKETVNLDVTSLLDYYYAGDGIAFDETTRKFSVDLKEGEKFLVVDAAGLGVNETALWGAADGKYDTKGAADDALSAATAYTDTAIANLNLDTTYEKAGVAQELINGLDLPNTYESKGTAAGLLADYEKAMETVLASKANVGDSYLKDDADAKFVAQVEGERLMTDAEGTKLAGVAEGAQVNVIESIEVNGVSAEVSDGKVANVEIAAKDITLGGDITGATGETIYSGETKISIVLQGIQDSIRAAVAGSVNSVTSDDGIIEVNNAVVNNPKVSLKVETASDNTVAAGHIEIVKGENGIYGMMYYDGDDAEK